MQSGRPRRRLEALRRLGGHDDVLPLLIEELGSRWDYRRAWAAGAIGDIGPDAKLAIPALLEALHDGAVMVRIQAAVALWKVGVRAKVAVDVLWGVLREEKEVLARDSFIRSFQESGAGRVIPVLLDRWIERIRKQAADAFLL